MTVWLCSICGEMDDGIPYVGWLETKPIWYRIVFWNVESSYCPDHPPSPHTHTHLDYHQW